MPSALRILKHWQIAAAPPWVKVVTGDLSSAVTRGPHVIRSLCLPKSLSSWSFLPVQTSSAFWSRGKAEGSKSPRSSEIGVSVLPSNPRDQDGREYRPFPRPAPHRHFGAENGGFGGGEVSGPTPGGSHRQL